MEFLWKSTCSIYSLLDDEVIIGGKNHCHVMQDLYKVIAAGSYPESKLYVQASGFEHEDHYDFDKLDDIKIWAEDLLPLQPVRRLILNKNIDNVFFFFFENEHPGLLVPGIY